jgi:ABC-2 type transport system permease protein
MRQRSSVDDARGMRYYLGLYGMYMRLFWRITLQYRADLIIFLVTMLVVDGLGLIFISLIFDQVRLLQGWSFYEVLLMYGLIRASTAISVLLFNAPWLLPGYIRSGMLDTVLVRPVSPLFQLIGNECLEPTTISSVLTAAIVIWVALAQSGLSFQLWWVGYILLVIGTGAILQFSLLLMAACLGFRFINVQSAMYPVGWLTEFARFPTTIYSFPLQFLLTWILPYATTSFYPAAFMLRGDSYWLQGALAPLAGPLFFGLALIVWRFSLRYYQGTGS